MVTPAHHRLKDGGLAVVIWRNTYHRAARPTTRSTRSGPTVSGDDTWKETDSLNADDLLAMAELLREAYAWIKMQKRADAAGQAGRRGYGEIERLGRPPGHALSSTRPLAVEAIGCLSVVRESDKTRRPPGPRPQARLNMRIEIPRLRLWHLIGFVAARQAFLGVMQFRWSVEGTAIYSGIRQLRSLDALSELKAAGSLGEHQKPPASPGDLHPWLRPCSTGILASEQRRPESLLDDRARPPKIRRPGSSRRR